MSECELCGKQAKAQARVEGIVVRVCVSCAKLGTPVVIAVEKPVRRERPIEVPQLRVDVAQLVKNAREEQGLSREALAHKLQEKASIIERVEHGMTPDARLAKKLEEALGIRLGYVAAEDRLPAAKEAELTLGDVVEVVVKKKNRV